MLVAALVFQTLGLVTAALGIRLTWVTYRTPDQRFAPIMITAWHLAVASMRWLLRRGPTVHGHAGAVLENVQFSARGVVGWGPLPPETDLAAMREEIQRRLAELQTSTQRVEGDLGDEREAREHADRQLREDLNRRVDAAEEVARQAATDGLWLEAVGLFLVAVGTVLGAIAA